MSDRAAARGGDMRASRSGGAALNRFLDALPRPRVFRGCAERPAFRSFGVAGYYAALIATFGAGVLAGRSLLVLAAVAAVCAISFFGWAYLRRAISGRETLVLLEHVWVAELASTGALYLLREPILPYLDAVAVGLSVFLAFGRVGCLLVGCCHGPPASVGVCYDEACARDGFPAHLVGVRLFPVQAIESLGLAGIALGGLFLVTGPEPGRALVWFLAAYAVLRFGLEGLRADERPHLLGLSQARWMALVELGVAMALSERGRPPTSTKAAALLLLLLTLAVALRIARRRDPRRRLLALDHLAELRAVVRASAARAEAAGSLPVPDVRRTKRWASVGVSLLDGAPAAHVSLALPLEDVNLRLLCDVAASALPELDPSSGSTSPASLLHVIVPLPLAEAPALASSAGTADKLYGAVLRRLLVGDIDEPAASLEEVAPPVVASTERRVEGRAVETARPANGHASPWERRFAADVELLRPWRRVQAARVVGGEEGKAPPNGGSVPAGGYEGGEG